MYMQIDRKLKSEEEEEEEEEEERRMERERCTESRVALIAGVTGMVGLALAEELRKPDALGGPWKVYGASRHPPPTWFPPALLHQHITLDATDLHDTTRALSPLSSEITHVFWLAIQVRGSEDENAAVNSGMLNNVLQALDYRFRHITIQTGTKHYMGPIFDPSLAAQLVPHEPPFSEEYPRLPYPNFYYALEDLVAASAAEKGFSYSVHRSSIIMGASSRSFYNFLLTLCVYAAICKHQGLPFRYFGNKYTWEHFCDMSDSRVLADQHLWAALTDKAKNQAFNCTNADVFTWKTFWKELSRVFELDFLPFNEGDDGVNIVELMKDKGVIWDDIVEENGLYKTKMEDITCFGAVDLVLKFDFQHVCSMNKSREYGFFGHANTLKSVKMWVDKLKEMKIIP